MEELVSRLERMPHSYFDFVAGIVAYVKKRPERLEKVLNYLDSTENITPSDVVKFVMDQPDFHDFSAAKEMQWVG